MRSEVLWVSMRDFFEEALARLSRRRRQVLNQLPKVGFRRLSVKQLKEQIVDVLSSRLILQIQLYFDY